MSAARLITFDVFGTLVDWRTGLARDCAAAGAPLGPEDFDDIIDRQGKLEQGAHASYADIVRRSLVDVVGLDDAAAARIGADVGKWPLYPDTADALRLLTLDVPCAALTNSDRSHGEQVQEQLGFRLSDWLCAEESGHYKPDPAVWEVMARRRGIAFGPEWWHVSAYADYDLAVANRLGLTTVFVARSHARPGRATYALTDLADLVTMWATARDD